MCKYPECTHDAALSWALVSLCEKHYELIKDETEKFYTKKIYSKTEFERRPHYLKISNMIPWSKERQGKLRDLP